MVPTLEVWCRSAAGTGAHGTYSPSSVSRRGRNWRLWYQHPVWATHLWLVAGVDDKPLHKVGILDDALAQQQVVLPHRDPLPPRLHCNRKPGHPLFGAENHIVSSVKKLFLSFFPNSFTYPPFSIPILTRPPPLNPGTGRIHMPSTGSASPARVHALFLSPLERTYIFFELSLFFSTFPPFYFPI